MGADHSMHLERCSRGFQMEYREIMLMWNKAQRDCQQIRDAGLKNEALQINRSIGQTLRECWQMSGENYPSFEEFVRQVEDNIVDDINTMEQLCQQGRHHHASAYGHGGGGGMGGSRPGSQGGYGGNRPGSQGGNRPGSQGGYGGNRPGGAGGGKGGHQFGSLGGSSNSMYRDEYMDRDSYNVNSHQHHAATVHGVMHCKGGVPLQKGGMYKIDFGEMRGHVGKLVDIQQISRSETRVLVVGRDRFGNEWEEEFDECRNEYGKIVFPIHRVR